MSAYDHLIQWCASEAADKRKYVERMESGAITLQQHVGDSVLDITRSALQIDKLKLDELEALLHTIAASAERGDASQKQQQGYRAPSASADMAERASGPQA
jgi:hypothetical protein